MAGLDTESMRIVESLLADIGALSLSSITEEDGIETRELFMYEDLHPQVVREISNRIDVPPTFCQSEPEGHQRRRGHRQYPSHVMGTFKCTTPDCTTSGWSSKKVAILIRSYPGNQYNAEVYNQRCEKCNELGTFTLNVRSYVERVSYRLLRWNGVELERPVFNRRQGLPHRRDLCEGCRRNICPLGDGLEQ